AAQRREHHQPAKQVLSFASEEIPPPPPASFGLRGASGVAARCPPPTERRVSMSKSARKRGGTPGATPVAGAKLAQLVASKTELASSEPGSKRARVIAMLKSPAGATINAVMKVTGWQQHSVRGFLAGVVRKRLKLKLGSKKVDGKRVYQITGGAKDKSKDRKLSKRRSS